MKLTYGNGTIQTQQGNTHEGLHCLCLTQRPYTMPVGSTPDKWEKSIDESKIDVILEFKTLASARVLQDELNDMISRWSKEEGGIAKVPEGQPS